jgi:hypothetical protein
VRRHARFKLSEATVPAVIAQKLRLFMQIHSLFRFGFDVGARANVDARISHLAESNRAAFEHANAATGTAAGRQGAAKEFLNAEIPERQALKGHHYRTHRRL